MKNKSNKLSGGPISAKEESEYHALQKLILSESDVFDLVQLARYSPDKWIYMIRTPLDWVSPKYVIGLTDSKNEVVQPLFKCDAYWSAESKWSELTQSDEAP